MKIGDHTVKIFPLKVQKEQQSELAFSCEEEWITHREKA